jgi:trk system potassium uptake protein TrkH
VSIRIVFKYLGLLLVVLGAAFALPLGCSVLCRDGAVLAFVAPGTLAVALGLGLWRLIPVERRALSLREGLALVTVTWVAGSLVGALPYTMTGVLPRYVDAVFEAMSGFTTTGATVFTVIGAQPRSILLWRNFSQWLGGMGIITLFVAFFPVLGVGAARIFEAEMPGPQPERLRARVRDTSRTLWATYTGFSVVQLLLLAVFGGLPLFDALNVTFATMPTGGFLHLQQSIGAYADNVFVTTVVTVFMLLAGTNFALFYYVRRRGDLAVITGNPEFRLYAAIFVGATVLVVCDLVIQAGYDLGPALQHAAFQVASIQTTTGFTTTDYDLWPAFSKAILLVLMIIGASAGSTGGGLKVVRLLVIAKYAVKQIVVTFQPRSVVPVKVGGRTVPDATVSSIVGMGILYVLTLGVGYLLLSALGLDATTAFSAVAATTGNVGPGLAGVGPAQDYMFIPAFGKIVLTPAFWRWR